MAWLHPGYSSVVQGDDEQQRQSLGTAGTEEPRPAQLSHTAMVLAVHSCAQGPNSALVGTERGNTSPAMNQRGFGM